MFVIIGIVVVLGGDEGASSGQVLDRVVAAVMPELEPPRPPAKRQPDQLVTEANAENRDARFNELAHGLNRIP